MITIKIDGMSCGHCRAAVEKALSQVDGVETIHDINLDKGQAQVSGTASAATLIAAIEEAGYDARIDE